MLVVLVKVAVLALALSVHKAVRVNASVGEAVSSVFVIAVVAHALGVVLLGFVRALNDLHGLSLSKTLDSF